MLSVNGADALPVAARIPVNPSEHANALELAHARLMRESLRSERLQNELFQTRATLEKVQADLSQSRASERHALHLANHDGLTALPNRRAFLDRMRATISATAEGGADLALLFIDLDRFKAVNDTYGHPVGDELLKIVSSRLMQAVRGRDVVGRLGGDEFSCLLMEATSRQMVSRVANKLFHVIAAPTKLGSNVLSVHPSIGIVLFHPGGGVSAERLLQHADSAMYMAKRQQCRHVFFDHDGEGRRGQQDPRADC